eukprot:CAMPEP_0113663584 /NCGR_PEP_ID=MMETSP0038_2-20120614/1234_1 /TAXON_ID=2898 /ORGANISM="Cryptomonas paramecium" /LENGTH=105 /DNA_ID=CAMNT_0000578649 /DNA_START=52 /DNA_END=369 /DNA_ORIENTATION=- /assembly_acc=CAM_ASM_000170
MDPTDGTRAKAAIYSWEKQARDDSEEMKKQFEQKRREQARNEQMKKIQARKDREAHQELILSRLSRPCDGNQTKEAMYSWEKQCLASLQKQRESSVKTYYQWNRR